MRRLRERRYWACGRNMWTGHDPGICLAMILNELYPTEESPAGECALKGQLIMEDDSILLSYVAASRSELEHSTSRTGNIRWNPTEAYRRLQSGVQAIPWPQISNAAQRPDCRYFPGIAFLQMLTRRNNLYKVFAMVNTDCAQVTVLCINHSTARYPTSLIKLLLLPRPHV